MAELPESLNKYLPGPLSALLGIAWWAGGDRIKEGLQALFSEPAAHILIQDHAEHLHVVRIEISPHSENSFEDVQVKVELQAKPQDMKGELTTLDGVHTPLLSVPSNGEETIYVFNKLASRGSSITASSYSEKDPKW